MNAMKDAKTSDSIKHALDRRSFLKASAALAAVTAANPIFVPSIADAGVAQAAPALILGENLPDLLENPEDIIFSVCQMCHSRCGIRAKVKEGILLKIDGNPYHPTQRDVDENNLPDRVDYLTPPDSALTELGRACLKGQAGVQTVYDPLRVQHPLKRVGPRNSGQWEAISWEQAFSEIAARINELIPPAERDDLIDPTHPELGPKRNQLVFAPGRTVEKELSERIWKHGWGTVNYGIQHTSICEESRHVANELITWDPNGSKNALGAGRTEGWLPDVLGSEYIIYFGANPLEACFPMVGAARNLMQFKRNGGQYVVVDPRFNNSAIQAHRWVPVKPGTDAALAMGMISWIIDNNAFDATYLENTNQAAAADNAEPTWTDSTYLVGSFTDGDGKSFQRYLTAGEVGIVAPVDDYVVVSPDDGNLYGHNEIPHGVLEAARNVTIDGQTIASQTAFSLLRDAAQSTTRAEYAAICGVDVSMLETLADEFTAHGKKAVATTYRGVVKHTNGIYNQWAIQHLNTLIGNYDWKGGCTAGAGGWSHKSGVVDLNRVAGDPGRSGIRIDRAMSFYTPEEAGSLFEGYPAPRPWFPFATHGNYQEAIPSIQDGYPYPVKVLMTYWNAWPYSTPALKQIWEETVADEAKLPLLVTISPVIGEVAAWADYVLPDSVYLEKFAVPGIPWRVNKGTAFQRPVVGDFDGKPIGVTPDNGGVGNSIPVGAVNNYTPSLPDTRAVLDIHIGLAKALGLPGVGDNALLDDNGVPVGHLHNSWDWAGAMLSNITLSAQSKYPGLTIEQVLARGGVFDQPDDEYDFDQLAYRYGNIIRTFIDPVARTRDSVTGEYYSGVPHFKTLTHLDGTPLDDAGYPFKLITYKTVHHGQARTNVNPWLMLMVPENFIEIAAADARSLGFESGDLIKVTSVSNPTGVTGKVLVTEGLAPGVVAISHHYGHWEQHSRPITVNGHVQAHDPSRGRGVHPGQLMRRDRLYNNVSLQDPIGASCSYFDTQVRVAKV